MERIICLVMGYVFGLFQTGYIYGKVKGIDIRQHGSGNSGSTNALRVMGVRAGLIVFLGDFFKTVIPCFLVRILFGSQPDYLYVWILYAGFGVILGHNFPFYMGFKGGKGIAVMIGMTAAMAFSMDIRLAIPNALIGFGMAFATRYVSVGSLLFALTLPISAYLLGFPREMLYLTIFVSAMAFWRHRGNIKKLLNGTENKFGSKK